MGGWRVGWGGWAGRLWTESSSSSAANSSSASCATISRPSGGHAWNDQPNPTQPRWAPAAGWASGAPGPAATARRTSPWPPARAGWSLASCPARQAACLPPLPHPPSQRSAPAAGRSGGVVRGMGVRPPITARLHLPSQQAAQSARRAAVGPTLAQPQVCREPSFIQQLPWPPSWAPPAA